MLRAILLAFALTLSAVPVVAGPFEDGEAAYHSGDYETAVQLNLAAARGTPPSEDSAPPSKRA